MQITQAYPHDIQSIYTMLNSNGKTLKRTKEDIADNLSYFSVLISPLGTVVGCVSYEPYTSRLAELRSLYIKPSYRGQGWGQTLVKQALIRKQLGQHTLIITDIPEFFQKFGFQQYEKACLIL